MACEVQITRLAKAQLAGLRGKALAAFNEFKTDLAQHGCAALGYRLTGDVVEQLCVKHLRGSDRVVVAFPEPDLATVVLVGRHTDDPNTSLYALLYNLAGLQAEPVGRRTKPACCDSDGAAPLADPELIEQLTRHTRELLRPKR